MARIIGGLATSHIPAIGGAIAKGLQKEPYWKPFFDGFDPAREWLASEKPDVAIVFYNDHGLNFFLDKMPTFAVGAAPNTATPTKAGASRPCRRSRAIPELSWAIIDHLIDKEFDLVTCQEMLVDHAFTVPLKLFWPDGDAPAAVPVCINTVQFPLPSAKRCYAMGKAVGEAISGWEKDMKVVTIGSGGLSHQLEGERAGFINKPFDLAFLRSMVDDPEWATQFSILELVEKTGTQGVELVNWLAARAAASPGPMRKVCQNYHIPISNTAAATLVLEAA